MSRARSNAGCRDAVAGRAGSALVLVLWIIGMLSMMVTSFAFDAHLEGKVVSYSRKRLKAEQFAISGFELAKSYLRHSAEITGNETDEEKEDDPRYSTARDLRNGRPVRIDYTFTGTSGEEEGTVSVNIEPEDARRNVNKLTEEDWERLLESIGMPETYWPDLIDSFFDWTDEDDYERENGAETEDYYERQDPPYGAANAPLDSVRELLLIRGFTEAVLTGGAYDPDRRGDTSTVISNGVERLLSVYGDGKVNINSVPDDPSGWMLLMSIPGVEDEDVARAILEERELGENLNASDEDLHAFTSLEDARSRLANIVEDNGFFANIAIGSQIFRITCIGAVGRVSKRVSAVVFSDGDIWRILRWEEEAQ